MNWKNLLTATVVVPVLAILWIAILVAMGSRAANWTVPFAVEVSDAGAHDLSPDLSPPAAARVVVDALGVERGTCTGLLLPEPHPCWRVVADLENIGGATASEPSAIVGVYGKGGRKYAEVALRVDFPLAAGEHARVASPWRADDVDPDEPLDKGARVVLISTAAGSPKASDRP